MNDSVGDMLKKKFINGWNLFWLITAPISIVMIVAMIVTDLTNGAGVSSLIQLSVRCAVPLLYLAFAASSVHTLFRGDVSRWMLRNRKYIGLSFAAAMAWQGFFILWLVTVYNEYYVDQVYVLRDAIEGVIGYFFVIAMTITSFQATRRRMQPKTWRLLHLSGIYFIWAYAFSTYWWALFYYANPVPLDYAFYWCGFLAWALRVAAWNKKRRKSAAGDARHSSSLPALNVLGIAVVAFGFFAAGCGSLWYGTAEKWLTGYAITRVPETYLPYWPFEPWLPLAVIAFGMMLATKARTSTHRTGGLRSSAIT
jgi:DMSO/TMAO reductase YedYZ heme-binding membrane subunit